MVKMPSQAPESSAKALEISSMHLSLLVSLIMVSLFTSYKALWQVQEARVRIKVEFRRSQWLWILIEER